MSTKRYLAKVSALALILMAASGLAVAGGNGNDNGSSGSNGGNNNAAVGANTNSPPPTELAYHAAGVLRARKHQPANNRIPQSLINGAHCIAVFPAVFKEGLVFAGRNGNGLVSCRRKSGHWGAPAFFGLSGGSFGFQGGAKTTTIVVLFMKPDAIEHLIGGNVQLGAKANVAGGPGSAHAKADSAPAPVVAYHLSSSGGFVGAQVKGAKLSANQAANQKVYGKHSKVRQILHLKSKSPDQVQVFTKALQEYAPASKYNAHIKVQYHKSSQGS